MQGQFISEDASIAVHAPIEQGVRGRHGGGGGGVAHMTTDTEKAFDQIQHLFMIKKKKSQRAIQRGISSTHQWSSMKTHSHIVLNCERLETSL